MVNRRSDTDLGNIIKIKASLLSIFRPSAHVRGRRAPAGMAAAFLFVGSLCWSRPAAVLSNGVLTVELGTRGLRALSLPSVGAAFSVESDSFSVTFGDNQSVVSAELPRPRLVSSNSTHATLRYVGGATLEVDVMYALGPTALFVSKALLLRHTGPASLSRDVTRVTLFNSTRLCRLTSGSACAPAGGSETVRSHYGLKNYALFQRWGAAVGAIFTAQNPYLDPLSADAAGGGVTLGFADAPLVEWNSAEDGPTLVLDSGFLGLHALTGRTLPSPADPIDEAEHEVRGGLLTGCRRGRKRAEPWYHFPNRLFHPRRW